MRQVDSPAALIFEQFDVAGKNVVDVGCGLGDLSRTMARQRARVFAIDSMALLARAHACPGAGEWFVGGAGEALPLRERWADAVLCLASLHHVPADRLDEALRECGRVLKPGGRVIVIEPVQSSGSWGDLTRLVEDESEAQQRTYDAILRFAEVRGGPIHEEHVFIRRSFLDFERLIETFVDDASLRRDILSRARAITVALADEAGASFEDYSYRSYCRLNVLHQVGDRT